jgi:hypothetical protein
VVTERIDTERDKVFADDRMRLPVAGSFITTVLPLSDAGLLAVGVAFGLREAARS